MNYEKIIKRKNESQAKIMVIFGDNGADDSIPCYAVSIFYREFPDNWFNLSTALEASVTTEEIHAAKIECWELLRPTSEVGLTS